MSFDSSVNDERIFVRIIEPADKANVKAVLQIAHGMAEHSLLYVDFAKHIASNGYAVAINDHLGHGKSVSEGGAYGYFGKGGCQNMVKDMHKLYTLMREDYPAVPYIMMGHSMGSFLARSYTAQYGSELNAAIYLGTCGNLSPAVFAAEKLLGNAIVKKRVKRVTTLFSQSFPPENIIRRLCRPEPQMTGFHATRLRWINTPKIRFAVLI